MLGLNFLVANQIDQAIDELSKAAQAAGRSAGDSPDPRQPVSREGTGRPRDPGAPEPAAAPEPAEARARQRAALPRPRLSAAAASSIARSRRSRKCCSSTRGTATRCRTSRSCTRSSTSGTRPTRCGRSSRRCRRPRAASPTRRGTTRSSRSSRTSSARRRCAEDYHEAATRRFEAAIERDARNAPAHLSLGDVRFSRTGIRPTRIAAGSASSTRHPSARTWRSRGSKSAYPKLGAPDRFPALCQQADRGEPAGLARAARPRAPPRRRRTGRRTRSSCCSKRSCTIRTRSRCTRRSGRRSRR